MYWQWEKQKLVISDSTNARLAPVETGPAGEASRLLIRPSRCTAEVQTPVDAVLRPLTTGRHKLVIRSQTVEKLQYRL